MATSPGSTVVPLRKETKARLDEQRGDRTYDEVVRDLIEGRARPAPTPRTRTRDPEEQIALARLAATRWRLSVQDKRIVELGPRLVIWNAQDEEPRDDVRYTWLDGRGLAP